VTPGGTRGRTAGTGATPFQAGGRSLVLEICVRLVFHAILAISVFFLVSGHNAPGGGFIGGLVAGTAFVLRYLVSSGGRVSGEVRLSPSTVLGAGLLLGAGAAMGPWLLGGQALESAYTYVQLPVLGALPLASVLVFDTGVFLIVVGLVLGVLSTLGDQTHASLGGEGFTTDDDTENAR
jgi:multisubunit Na+/H+ antiporter MnhB subunit